jgi:hypothetical protein
LLLPEQSPAEFDKERARNRAITQIMGETRVGEVDGIYFDLRHEQINPEEWVMEDDLGTEHASYAIRRRETLPFIWFPWYGQFDLKQVKAEVSQDFIEIKEYAKNGPPLPRGAYGKITDAEYENLVKKEKEERVVPNKTWIKEEIVSRTPDAVVTSGDRIETHHVIINLEGDDEFIPIQDRAFVHLFVKITRRDGSCQVLNTPIMLYGQTRLSYFRGNNVLYSILGRVRRFYSVPKLDTESTKEILNADDFGHAFSALRRAVRISDKILPRVLQLRRSQNMRRLGVGREYMQALDDACMLGYSWAYAETEQHMRPLAIAGAASRAAASRAGQTSGERRRVKAASTWQRLVKSQALEARAENPGISQSKLAEEIKFKFDNEVPSHPIIVRHIAKLEREGELPKRRA